MPGARPALTFILRADDKFRSRFLWGRKPLLASCAARLRERRNLVWVDLGGGTGVSIGAAGPVTANVIELAATAQMLDVRAGARIALL